MNAETPRPLTPADAVALAFDECTVEIDAAQARLMDAYLDASNRALASALKLEEKL